MSEKDNRYKVLTDIDISRHDLLNVQKIEGSEYDALGKTLEITTPPSSTSGTGSIVIHPGVFTSDSSSETGGDSETVDTSKSGSLYLYAGENSLGIEDGNLLGVDENPKGITLFPDSNISIISDKESIIEKSEKNLRLLAGDPTDDLSTDDFQKSNLKNYALLDLSSSELIYASLGVSKETKRTSDYHGFPPAPQISSIRLFCSEDSENPTDATAAAASLEEYTSGIYINKSNRLEVLSSYQTNNSAKTIANSWGIIGKDSSLKDFKKMLETYFSPSFIRIGDNNGEHCAFNLGVEFVKAKDSEENRIWNPLGEEYEWVSTEHVDNLNVHKNLTFDGSGLAFKSSKTITIDAPTIKIGTNEEYRNTDLQIHSNSLKIDSNETASSIEVENITVNKSSTVKGKITLGEELKEEEGVVTSQGITIKAPTSVKLTSPNYSIGFTDADPILSGNINDLILNVDEATISASLTSEKSTLLKGESFIDGRLTVTGVEASVISNVVGIGNEPDTKAVAIGNDLANLTERSNTLTSTSNTITETVVEKKSSNIESYDLAIKEFRIGDISKDASGAETFGPVGDFKVEVNDTSSSVQSSTVTATNYVEASNLYVNKLSIYWDDNSNSVVFAKRA